MMMHSIFVYMFVYVFHSWSVGLCLQKGQFLKAKMMFGGFRDYKLTQLIKWSIVLVDKFDWFLSVFSMEST